jgi:hypothetical protein
MRPPCSIALCLCHKTRKKRFNNERITHRNNKSDNVTVNSQHPNEQALGIIKHVNVLHTRHFANNRKDEEIGKDPILK